MENNLYIFGFSYALYPDLKIPPTTETGAMSYSLERLVELFGTKGFVPNNYFTLDGKYKLVEIINIHTAASIIVDIDSKYNIPAKKGKHEYQLTSRQVSGDIYNGPVDEANLRSSYQEIDHISKALESEEKLHDLYDKPISLKGEEDKSQQKFASCYRQMKRFRLCVRNIPFKLALFEDDCLCLLNANSELEAYFVGEYKFKKRKIFVTTSLSNFFGSDDISQSVLKISDQFYDILDDNQKVETGKIQAMIDAKRSINNQSRKILAMKQKLRGKINEYQKKHNDLTEKQQELRKKLRELRASPATGPKEQANRAQIAKYTDDISRNDSQLQEFVKIILDTRKELDELFLVVDNVLFDNMVMMTKTTENFRILERLKLS
jgi:hypothetical protein